MKFRVFLQVIRSFVCKIIANLKNLYEEMSEANPAQNFHKVRETHGKIFTFYWRLFAYKNSLISHNWI